MVLAGLNSCGNRLRICADLCRYIAAAVQVRAGLPVCTDLCRLHTKCMMDNEETAHIL